MSAAVNPALNCNKDSTSFTVGKNISQARKVKVLKAAVRKKLKRTIKTMPDASSDHGDGLYSIIFELLISADGTMGPCVFVLAHGGMGEGMTPTSLLYCCSYVFCALIMPNVLYFTIL